MTQNSKSSKLWGGCFTKDSNNFLVQLNNSLNVDKRLFNEDIVGSKAYAEILFDTKLITSGELLKIKAGLEHVRSEWLNGTIDILESDEDIHTANERRLSELIGCDIGGKLHTGRSRNDQVAVDMKLWILKAIEKVRKDLMTLIETMINNAENYMHVLMPGYTHLQRAQAVRFSHWILSYAFSFKVAEYYLIVILFNEYFFFLEKIHPNRMTVTGLKTCTNVVIQCRLGVVQLLVIHLELIERN